MSTATCKRTPVGTSPIVESLIVTVSLDAIGPLASDDYDDAGVMLVLRGD